MLLQGQKAVLQFRYSLFGNGGTGIKGHDCILCDKVDHIHHTATNRPGGYSFHLLPSSPDGKDCHGKNRSQPAERGEEAASAHPEGFPVE